MTDIDNRLIVHRLRPIAAGAADGSATEEQWRAAEELYHEHAWEDEGLELALLERDASEIARRLAEWDAGKQPFPAPDRAVLKRALKAFRKRIKLQQLDEESGLGGGPFSAGRRSRILAIRPPEQYPAEVWQELHEQRRLRHDGDGFYELLED
jgi:hypothetical protein